MVQTVTGLLHWGDTRGCLGEAAYQQEHYPDDNTIRSEYAWLLVPLVRHGGLDLHAAQVPLAHQRSVEVQVGYALAASNANESRFVLAQPNQPYPPSDPRFSTAGSYVPYYTPGHLITHSAIAAFTLRPATGATFHLDGSYAVRATDDAPFFAVSGGQVLLSTYSRRFSPWKVRTSLNITRRNGLTLEPMGEIGRTVFYSWAAAGLQVTYSFKAAKASAQ